MESTIMKKTYINPTLEVVQIQTQQMLAASDTNMSITSTPVASGTEGDAREDGYDW